MHNGVRPEGVVEFSERPVHEIAVQRPLKKRGEHNAPAEADRRPKNKRFHIHVDKQMRVF
jgi:hypothetical protein